MKYFSNNLIDLNQKHSLLDNSVAERINNEYPQIEHAFSAREGQDSATSLSQTAAEAKVIVLLPLNDHPRVRKFLEQAFHGLISSPGSKIAVDLDIDSPYTDLLGGENIEGISDFFLYGVSPARIITSSPFDAQLQVLNAGTFTPRSAEIYVDPRWQKLIQWVAGRVDGPVILLGPPLERFPDLTALQYADRVFIFAADLDSASQEKLPELISRVIGRSSPATAVSFAWLGKESEKEKEEIGAMKAAEEGKSSAGPETPQPVAEETVTGPGDKEGWEETLAGDDILELPEGQDSKKETEPVRDEEPEKPLSVKETFDEFGFPKVDILDEKEGSPLAGEFAVSTPGEKPGPGESKKAESSPEKKGRRPLTVRQTYDEFGFPKMDLIEEDEEIPIEKEPGGSGMAGKEAPQERERKETEDLIPEEEEIFLPDDLLFFDDVGSSPGKEEKGGSFEKELHELSLGELPKIKDLDQAPEGAGSGERESLPEHEDIADSGEIEEALSAETPTLPVEERPEPVSSGLENIESAKQAEEPEEIKAGEIESLETPHPDMEAEALFTEAQLGEEIEAEEEPVVEEQPVNEASAAEALSMMERFQEILSASPDREPELEIDNNPLGEAQPVPVKAEQEGISEEAAAETGEPESLDEGDLQPLEEEVEAAQPVPEKGAEALETEKEPALEAAGENLPGEPALGEIEEKAAEPVSKPDESSAAKEKQEEAEVIPINREAPADQKVAPLTEEELQEIDETVSTSQGLGTGTEKAPLTEKSGEFSLEGTDLMGPSADIDLGELDQVAVKAAPRRGRKKKPSRGKPVAVLFFLLLMAGGMLYIWRQGTVSHLVRQLPGFLATLGISSGFLNDYVAKISEAETAADTAKVVQQTVQEPVPPKYIKLDYSIQLGSFRFLPQAIEAQSALQKNGLANVYVVPLELDSLGSWNRLYVGFYKSPGEADTALVVLSGNLRKIAGEIRMGGEAIRRYTPLALKIGDFSTSDSLESIKRRLEDHNIPAYIVKLDSDSSQTALYRLYVGAFETESQAVLMRTQVFNIGIKAEIIQREGLAKVQG